MKRHLIIWTTISAIAHHTTVFAEPSHILISPGRIHSIELEMDKGELHARVKRGERILVKDLTFGHQLSDGSTLKHGVSLQKISSNTMDERYPIPAGKSREVRNHYRDLIVSLTEQAGSKRQFQIEFRAYDDGVAFRYHFPAQSGMDTLEIVEELTTLSFPANHDCWVSSWDRPHHSNEAHYDRKTLNSLNPETWLQRPITIQRDDGIALCLYEAALMNHAGLFFRKVAGAENTLRTRLAPLLDVSKSCAVIAKPPHVSPWRVIQTADNPVSLIPSNLVLNLNEPCRIRDTSWILPGKAMFPWWPSFRTDSPGVPNKNCFENQKDYIDFAAANGIRYLELEPPWYETKAGFDDGGHTPENSDPLKPLPEIRIEELISYARGKGVGVFLWIHQSVLAPRMDEIMTTYKRWGAVGMKVDFFDHNDQETVRKYQEMTARAAEHGLMIFLHGADVPTGVRRTWPNLITREGVLGNEYNKWSNLVTLKHTVTLPFTRMVPGPMDFTPGGFRNVQPDAFRPDFKLPMVMGTRSRQLAMFVVYESPLQMVCDYPGAYRDQPGTDFLRQVPTNWDETRGLAGSIGEFIVLARRKGDQWYLGAMTDEKARVTEVDLGFLQTGRSYAVETWSDDAQDKPATALVRDKQTCTGGADRKFTLNMAGGGGAAVVFTPMPESRNNGGR